MKGAKVYLLLGAMLLLVGRQDPAGAITLGLQPASQSVSAGNALAVDVVVSGLASASEIVSAFELNISYDPNILAATAVTFGTLLGDEALFESITGSTLTPGNVELAETSLLADSALALLQSDSFTLATVSLKAIAAGSTDLVFVPDPVFGIDVKGRNATILTLNVSAAGVSVTGSPSAAPEPATLALVGLGIVGMGYQRRRPMSA